MSTEENKVVIRHYLDAWNKGDLMALDELLLPTIAYHELGNDLIGCDAVKQVVTAYRAAFPDLQFTIDDIIAEGDTVVARWLSRGTQKGELKGIPPTGKPATVTGISVFCLAEGRIRESWSHWDALGMMQQLGVIPAPGQ